MPIGWFGIKEEGKRYGFGQSGSLSNTSMPAMMSRVKDVDPSLVYFLHRHAKLAVDVFVSGIVHYIGAFFLDLDRLDYLVFTAGIGEHSHRIRSMVCRKLAPLGVRLDEEKNRNCRGAAVISAEDSAVCVRVIPTDEELGIARWAYEM